MLPVRITEEKFANFPRYFQSIIDHASNRENIEILIKFDDDQNLADALKVIEDYQKQGLKIKHIVTPKGRGFQYLSYFLLDLLFISDSDSELLAIQSIDMRYICKDFDKILIEASQKYQDGMFVIHPNDVFDLKNEITDINKAVQHVEKFPFWSRKWIEIQGNFGYNSFMDGYTALVEYLLFKEHGIDRRIGINTKLVEETHGDEAVVSQYWQGPRKKAMEIHLSPQSIAFAKQAAKNLAMNIMNAWNKDDYTNYLLQSILSNYDNNILLECKNHALKENLFNLEANLLKLKRIVRKRSQIACGIATMVVIIIAIYIQ